MQPLPLTESTLGDVVEVDYICPNCLHVEHVVMLIVEKED